MHDGGHLPRRPVAGRPDRGPEGHQPAGRRQRGRRRAGHAGRRAVVLGLLAVQPPRPGRLPGRRGPGPACGERAVPAAGAGPAGGGGPGERAPAQPGAGTGRGAARGQPRAGAQHGDSRPPDQGGARGRGAGRNRPGGVRADRPPGGHRGPLRQPAGVGRTGPARSLPQGRPGAAGPAAGPGHERRGPGPGGRAPPLGGRARRLPGGRARPARPGRDGSRHRTGGRRARDHGADHGDRPAAAPGPGRSADADQPRARTSSGTPARSRPRC